MSIQLMTITWQMSIPAGPKLVLLALCDNANDQGECYPAVATIAKKCSMSERSVFSHIDWLEKMEFLYRENRAGRSTVYHIKIDDPCKIRTPAKPAPLQNLHTEKIAPPPAKSAPITITKPSSNHTSVATAPEQKKSGAVRSTADAELQSACKAVWKSYSDTYFNRYGVEPLRNAQVNTGIKSFCKKIPYQEAPHVAAFFVAHNDKFYVQKTHAISLMVKDAEGLRTQWATGRTSTTEKFDPVAYVNRNRPNGGVRHEIVIESEKRN